MKAIIFAGGVGTRLWPLSRKSSPKQFEKIIGNKSTLQLAVERLIPEFEWKDIYISTGATYVDIVEKQLPNVPKQNVIGEPLMRDVGPAVGLITAILYKQSAKVPLTILWSDHLVGKQDLFKKILKDAGQFISKNTNKIVFIAQKPRFASQNLGWIEYGSVVNKVNETGLHSFKSFKYRPDLDLAKVYFNSGHHAWNLGYFVTTPEFLWKQYQKQAPEMFALIKEIYESVGTNKFTEIVNRLYSKFEKINFDNLILEKIKPEDAFVISENLQWSDVGAWEALKEALQKHQSENITSGKVLVQDSQDSLIYNYTNQLVVAIDLEGLLVVNTGDVTLVAHKNSVPKIKKIVESFSGTENEKLT
ncbi:mannose-1-phosphate guanylyltransferase [Candidatus Gottesmanbacteria bacterium]|nr:mannose-1-phosphate guanylyltransferase [Candidatus Gottesmanbacteria bacterium]